MPALTTNLALTETEVRSYLPSGWGIVSGSTGQSTDAGDLWSIEVYDGAGHVWRVEITSDAAARAGRLEAFSASIDRLTRKALGRKSIISG